MKVVNQSFEILTPISDGGIEELKAIEEVARTCYKSESLITEDGESAKKMVRNLIAHGHEAMLEQVDIRVRFTTDRGVSHEIVRHRLASYGQESTRYCNYSKGKFGNEITCINLMNGMRLDTKMCDMPSEKLGEIYAEWYAAMCDAEKHYMRMLDMGCTPQMARSVLPNSLKTELNMKANVREWRNFFKLRCSEAAHPQMREIACALLAEFKARLPILFDDIEVNDYDAE